MWDLNSQVTNISGWTELTVAQAINDNGQITGFGTIGGQVHAMLLTPVGQSPGIAQWLSFLEGNPGKPGDGVLVNAGGVSGTSFDLSTPFALGSATAGLTTSVFATGVTSISIDMSTLKPSPCNAVMGVSISGGAVTPSRVNGVDGIVGVLPQANLDGVVSFANQRFPGCNFTLKDFYIVDLGLYSPAGSVTNLDAASLGLGQGNIPLQ
jgi:hypothetical protein